MTMDGDVIRPAGLLERFHIIRHFLELDSCVLCAAQYIIPELQLDKRVLFPALHKVVQLHAALGVRVSGESSRVQSFVRLKAIDLSEVVEFSDSDDLRTTFEAQFQQPFNTSADLPLWRVVVLKNNFVCFAWHHSIGDGLSGLAFHRALLVSLQEGGVITNDQTVVHLPSTSILTPALENVMNISPSWSMILRTLYDIFAPTSWTRGTSAWTGRVVPVNATLKTQVRLIHFPPQDVAAFLSLCKSNNTSLTGALYTLAVSVLSRIILSNHNIIPKTISFQIPISLRGVAGISQDVFCECLTTLHSFPTLHPNFSWTEAYKFTTILQSYPKSGEEIGMLKYLYGNYTAYFRGKLGSKRQVGLELSNVGVFRGGESTSARDAKWSIGKMAFAQCDSIVGAALKINVIGDPIGGMAVTVTCGEASVEDSMVESFVSGFEHGFMELLMRR